VSDRNLGAPPGVPGPLVHGRVRTRRPRRQLALVAVASLAALALLACAVGLRGDLADLPPLPLALYAGACLAGFGAQLAVALVPRRGDVLPAGYRAARVSLLVAALIVPLTVCVGTDVLGARWIETSRWWSATLRCATIGVSVAAVCVGIALLILRGTLTLAGWRSSLSVAAAGGALAAFVLELHCSVAEIVHVGLGHTSAIALPALALAVAALAARW
jgi:hypothetical protein